MSSMHTLAYQTHIGAFTVSTIMIEGRCRRLSCRVCSRPRPLYETQVLNGASVVEWFNWWGERRHSLRGAMELHQDTVAFIRRSLP